jgi:D-alanyl-D-alanine carboxypeptidase
VHEGKLALDERIGTYLGDEEWFDRLPNASDITVRMLMRHTSGLVRYELNGRFLADLSRDPDRVWKPAEEIAYLFDSRAPFAAGEGWDYSDTNYIVLGMIIERVTGSKLYDEITRRLLKPLALNDVVPAVGRTVPGLVQGYAGEKNPFGHVDAMIEDGKFAINPQFEWAGGGFATTATDLARWAKALAEGRAFDAALMAEYKDGVEAKMLGPGARYGLGVILRNTPLGMTCGHSGFFPGYQAEMRYYVERRFAIAMQVNTSVTSALGKPLGAMVQELAVVVSAALAD